MVGLYKTGIQTQQVIQSFHMTRSRLSLVPKAVSASRPSGGIMLASNSNIFMSNIVFTFVNTSLLWCFITHLEDILGHEHCLQKHLFYHFFISRLLSTPVSGLKYWYVRNQSLLPPCIWNGAQGISTSRCPGQQGLLPTHSSLCKAFEEDKWESRAALSEPFSVGIWMLWGNFKNFSLHCYATWILLVFSVVS